MTDLAQLLLSWCNSFKKGKDFDAWGQFVEAGDEYTRLSRQIKKQLAPENQFFTDEQKKILSKVAACLQMRSKSFQNSQAEYLSLEDLRQVYPVLETILSGKKEKFPIKIEQTEQYNSQVECHLIAEDDFVKDQEDTKSGTLLARIPYEHNCHRLTITIVKIGVKEPWNYINPFITVSVKGLDGINITSSQDTPVSKIKQTNDIVFSCDVELQQVTEKLPKGSAVFFEFKHFKPKKKQVSTKCWAFMELDELKAGPACVELYKKPTDYCRKRINLMTIKPFYLHLFLTIHNDEL